MVSSAAWGLYGGPLAQAIRRMKLCDQSHLARPLASLMRPLVQAWSHKVELAIPVPLSRRRLLERGYNQSALLAHHACRSLTPVDYGALVRVRDTTPQRGLRRQARLLNLNAAFHALRSRVTERRVLLIDDVQTTGATAHRCAEALLRAGARDVHVLTLALAVP